MLASLALHCVQRVDCLNRFLRAAINSWNGLVAVFRSEAAFRQELAALALAIPLSFLLTADAGMRWALIGAVVLVLVVELLNTAIEKLCDRVTREVDAEIGRVKDMASAAAGLSQCLPARCGCGWSLGCCGRSNVLSRAQRSAKRCAAELARGCPISHKAHAAARSRAPAQTTTQPAQKAGSPQRG